MNAQTTALVLMLTGLLISSGCHAASEESWRVNNDLSKLSFISIKAGDIGEVHSFTRLDGTIESLKVAHLYGYDGLARVPIEKATAGEKPKVKPPSKPRPPEIPRKEPTL